MIGIVTISREALIHAAARNNAEWCALMSRLHGVGGEFEDWAWVAAGRTPRFYPDAVTLVPGVDPRVLVGRIDTVQPGASVKDSFADLDLSRSEFEVLFDAQWVYRSVDAPRVRTGLAWEVVADGGGLHRWALAWDGGHGDADLFRAGLLDEQAVVVIAGHDRIGQVVGGAVAMRSAQVIGVSNVFARDGDADTAWSLVLDVIHSLFPAMPVVGYEQGEQVEAAERHGFEALGPLRVWTHAGRP